MECVICRKEKENMSDEHVIPEALGGYYHIFSVCRSCNSKLGQHVDAPLVNHKLAELYRLVNEIEGKSGKLPNPFSGDLSHKEDKDSKFSINIGEAGQIDVRRHPNVEIIDDHGAISSIRITVDSKDEESIDQILDKVLVRRGIPKEAVVRGEKTREVDLGGIGGQWQIDLLRFKIGLLKIAYEFAVDSIEEYFTDENAVAISSMLSNAEYKAVERFVKIGSGLDHEVFRPFEDFLALEDKKHFLVLIQTETGLFCYVKLHDLFSVGVMLSDQVVTEVPSEKVIFGINDIECRRFRKLNIEDAVSECFGPVHLRFQYYFPTQQEAIVGQREIKSPNYQFEGSGSADIPLFNRDGKKLALVSNAINEAVCQPVFSGDWHITTCQFDDAVEYFVKSQGSGNLYRVIGVEFSKERATKL